MTPPRKVLPGTTYLVTRRVAQRVFLLAPCTLSKQIVEYCFGRALANYRAIELHCLQVPSDHYHTELTDHGGELPDFMAWVDREIAKAMNEHFARAENFWSSDHYSAVELRDREAVWGKCIYVFVNVVKAGLVRDYRDWPGVRSEPRDWLLGPKIVARPDIYFSQKDERWASVELRYTIPPQLCDRDPEQLVREMNAAIDERQRELREQARRAGKSFLGPDRVLKQSPFDRARSPHIKGRLNPTFAAGTAEGQQRAREERKSFLAAYREALHELKRGLECMFPAGSYKWPRLCAARCAPLEAALCVINSSWRPAVQSSSTRRQRCWSTHRSVRRWHSHV